MAKKSFLNTVKPSCPKIFIEIDISLKDTIEQEGICRILE
jgi:hypothetical protein